MWHQQVYVIDVEDGGETRITDLGHSYFAIPTWLPDGRTLAVLGHRYPARAGSRNDIWLFAADGSEADRAAGRNLSGRHDLMPGAGMGSDVTPGEEPRLAVTAGGRWITFSAPYGGSYELWRISTVDGDVVRITEGRHYLSAFDQVTPPKAGRATGGGTADLGTRIVYASSTPTSPTDLWALDVPAAGSGKGLAGRRAGSPISTPRRWRRSSSSRRSSAGSRSMDGRSRAGTSPRRRRPLRTRRRLPAGPIPRRSSRRSTAGRTRSMAGRRTWSSRSSPGRGSGSATATRAGRRATARTSTARTSGTGGPGPTRDVLAGVESLVADGLADPTRLGVTGGSYGGYLTNWIVGHDRRFRAAVTCRSVVDLTSQFLSGDIGGAEFGREEFGAAAWEDPTFYREHSPLTYAPNVRTPLLIQHSERDLRCTITQAEELFAILRIHGRPVRLMRVPDESHELTRSGTPYRRAENLVQIRDWFRHYLVDGKRGLPRLPRERAGR